jgi:hypothetical protein
MTRLKTPSGRPACLKISANFHAIIGVSLDGLTTTGLPVIIAPVLMPTRMAAGKLKGAMTPHTPYGFMTLLLLSFGWALSIIVSKPLFLSISLA